MDKGQQDTTKYSLNKFNEYKEFIKDKHVSFVIRKTERVVYGVYLLSQFVPEDDALLHDLKKTAHKVLAHVSQFVSPANLSSSSYDQVHGLLQYMSSLLTLSNVSGYISNSNIEIMKNEINYLHKHIEELSTRTISDSKQLHIKSDMFVVSAPKVTRVPEVKMSFIKKEEHTAPVQSLPKVSFKEKSTKPVVVRPANGEDRESRIIDVIRDKGVVSIKDISTVIFDVSEKTIQRTLQTLIDKGQIKKEGERRWAKYQLV